MSDLTYAALFLATSLYALALERLRRDPRRTYAPRWTWLTVVIGVAIVGAFVALRLALEVPPLTGQALAWWEWWVWVGHFVAGGAPIVIWQEVIDRRDSDAAMERLLERRRQFELDEGE